MEAVVIISVFLVFGISIPLTILFIVKASKRTNEIKELLKPLNGSYQGVSYTFNYYPGSKNHPAEIYIVIEENINFNLLITLEKKTDGFFKRIGLSDELQVQDPMFDNKFYLATEDRQVVLRFLNDKVRQAFNELSDMGFKWFRFNNSFGKTHIKFSKSPINRNQVNPETLNPAIKHVETIISGLKDVKGMVPLDSSHFGLDEKRKVKPGLQQIIFLVIPIVLLMVTAPVLIFIGNKYKPIREWELILRGAGTGILIAIFYLWLVIKKTKGTSSAHKVIIAILILALGSFSLTGYLGLRLANGIMDSDLTENHETIVKSKHYHSDSDSGTTYFIKVQSWSPGRKVEKFKVSQFIYNKCEPDKTRVIVTTKPGKFGVEWLVKMKIEGHSSE